MCSGGSAEMGGRPYWRTGSSGSSPSNGMTAISGELKWLDVVGQVDDVLVPGGSQVLPRRSVWATGQVRRSSSQIENGSAT